MNSKEEFQNESDKWMRDWQSRMDAVLKPPVKTVATPVKDKWSTQTINGELTFQEIFTKIFDEAFNLLVERQRKYGPENIRTLGMFGVFSRLASDKIERVRRGMNGTVVHGEVHLEYTDFGDESFDDALLDIANYALIMLCLKRGLWGAPLA